MTKKILTAIAVLLVTVSLVNYLASTANGVGEVCLPVSAAEANRVWGGCVGDGGYENCRPREEPEFCGATDCEWNPAAQNGNGAYVCFGLAEQEEAVAYGRCEDREFGLEECEAEEVCCIRNLECDGCIPLVLVNGQQGDIVCGDGQLNDCLQPEDDEVPNGLSCGSW